MKTAVVMTTINVPKVLEIYDKYAAGDADFFIAGDLRTPEATGDLCDQFGMVYLSPDDQKKWGSSEIIGWNTDSRRNFAVLEALQQGAELLISLDDDMLIYPDFFQQFEELFGGEWSGLQLGAPGYWFDHGQYTNDRAPARGIPRSGVHSFKADFVHDVTIGAAQGIILGVPDTDAVTAMNVKPVVHSAHDVLRNGFVTHPECYSVFNSQITAFRRELAPACVQFYAEQGRNTDIFASLSMRTLMRDKGWYTHYGLPMGYHNRSVRDLSKDLEAEKWGLANIEAFARGKTVDSLRYLKMYDLWMEDCAEAMK